MSSPKWVGVGEQEGRKAELQRAVVADADDVKGFADSVQRQPFEGGQERRVVKNRRAAGDHQRVPPLDPDPFQTGVDLDLHSHAHAHVPIALHTFLSVFRLPWPACCRGAVHDTPVHR